MVKIITHRPRNVNATRAASILYGDLGTSKVYVIGLAFALVGYASFWLIAAVSLLTLLIGLNYITICRYYPNGGGVYASVRHRSKIISMLGAFFIVADYLVTAALSALSAFSYFGVSDPMLFAAIFIGLIGLLNYFGPKHIGTLAFIISISTFIILTILALCSIPYLPVAWENIQPLQGSSGTLWKNFTVVIIALSGVEAIANTTGVMKLNRGTTAANPIVTNTSTKAIIAVILEVVIYTTLFAFVTAAINTFQITEGTVNAPGNPNVRDYMLKYLGEVFIGNLFGSQIGHWFSMILGTFIGVLLLSAVNTALQGLIALQYVMASDRELPSFYQKLNRFGVPKIPLLMATLIPIALVVIIRDVAGLASLYAIGFVGAIATNLGSTATDKSIDLKKWERSLMFFSFLIMAAIEVTLFIDKPHARIYVLAVIFFGFLLRALSKKFGKQPISKSSLRVVPRPPQVPEITASLTKEFSILCPVTKRGKALKTALKKSVKNNYPIFLLFIREQKVISEKDYFKTWEEDKEAVALLNYAKQEGKEELIHFYYTISDAPAAIITAYAQRFEVNQIYLDASRHGLIYQILKNNWAKEIRRHLSDEVTISLIL